MELSIWTICSRLRDAGLNVTPQIAEGRGTLRGLRFGGSEDRRYLSLQREVTAPDGTVCRCLLSSGVDRLLLPDAAADEVAERVFEIFEHYDRWEKRLLEAAVGGRSLQALLDIAYTAFERPMLIKNNSGWVFAAAGGQGDWYDTREPAEKRAATLEEIRSMSRDPGFKEMFRQRHPVIAPSPLYGGRVLRANVWQKDKRVCEIIALEQDRPFDAGDAQLMQTFARIVELYANTNQQLYFTVSDVSSFLSGLLEGEAFRPDAAAAILKVTCWENRDELAVVAIATHDHIETPLLSALRDDLETAYPNASVFIYRDEIVLLINVTRTASYPELVDELGRTVSAETFVCGYSYEFVGLEQFRDYHRQARTALDYAAERGLSFCTMHSLLPFCLSRQLRSEPWLQTLVAPDILRLREQDQERGTEYLSTLREFLLCGGNYTDTAKRMNLHRNTLIYRISKITELMHLDPQAPENRENLLYSYLLL